MKLSMSVNYTGDPRQAAVSVRELEQAGVDMVWVAELYSFDSISILGYLAAHTERMELATGILPLYSRTPALLGMTAAGLDAVSGGRFVLGLGASGPQVIEGWHGVPYTKPLTRTRETIEICRMVWKRERLEYHGDAYTVPLPPGQGTGLGKPLRIINHPIRDTIPVYVASLGPRNVQMTAEIADGWLPVFFDPDKALDVWKADLDAGAARRDPALAPLEVVAGGAVAICDEDTATRIRDAARPQIALYVGGMGARGKNFYNDLFRRYGYEREATQIQNLYLDGHKKEAEALVPDEFLRAVSMVGDEGRVRERIDAFKAAGVTRLSIAPVGEDRVHMVEKIRAWTD